MHEWVWQHDPIASWRDGSAETVIALTLVPSIHTSVLPQRKKETGRVPAPKWRVLMRRIAIPTVCVLLMMGGSAQSQQEPPKKTALQVEKGDTVRTVLTRQIDRKVTLVLSQGQELTGTVRSVGDGVVQLSDLSGRDFYDAVVDLQKIAAVVVKVRGQ